MQFKRDIFFATVRRELFPGRLSQSQVDGMEAILARWEFGFAARDIRWLAYMLATAYHETGRAMQPIEEVGRGRGKKYGEIDPEIGTGFWGRGLVQLTWRANYETMSNETGFDLVHHPELACRSDIAITIMMRGMMLGLFTGKRLSEYFGVDRGDWRGARRIINGVDRAVEVATYGMQFRSALIGSL